LAIWPAKEGAKLTWIASPAPAPGLAFAPVVVIDARTGDVVIRFNTAMTAKANVYPSNPVKSPVLSVVDLPLESGAATLENELVRALNCVDNHTVKDVGGTPIHLCDLLPKAAPDAAGDFLYLFPPAEDTAPEDAFAEVQLFHHANVAYERFRGFSPGLFVQEGPLPVIANLRLPVGFPGDAEKMADPLLPLAPFKSAFYSPADPSAALLFGIGGGAMWFGQGPTRDLSIDGDVVYHELTHAVIAATIRLVNHPRLDAYGASYAPGAMNEGLADYFSSTITGDPHFGEYAAADLAPGSPWIRSLEEPDACPTAIAGEPHQDATLFSGALWSVRASLSHSQAEALDGAIFKAMSSAPSGDLAYEELGELIRAEVAASMGEEVAGQIADAFAARGVFPRCTRVLEDQGEPLLGPEGFFSAWFAPGTQSVGIKGYAPGVVQVHSELPAGTTSVGIRFHRIHLLGGFSAGTPFAPKLLVKLGAGPITFGESPYAPLGEVREIDPERNGDAYSATIEVPPGVTEISLMIGNAGEADGAYTSIAIQPLVPVVASGDLYLVAGGGGGCAIDGGSGGGSAGLVALGFALALGRRRRAREPG
jgi:MYXO-CTERM domain-containing protein